MHAILPAKHLSTLCVLSLVALLFVMLPQYAFAQANVAGLRAGTSIVVTSNPMFYSVGSTCNRSSSGFLWGSPVYTPNITGTHSPVVAKEPCKVQLCLLICTPITIVDDTDYLTMMKIYTGTATIPPETDIRVCMVAVKNGVIALDKTKACTPWASASSAGVWQNAPDYTSVDNQNGEVFKIRVESRGMPGRSVTDLKLRVRPAANLLLSSLSVGSWAETPWRSAGGGWSPATGVSELVAGAKPSMQVVVVNIPEPNLVVSGVALNSGSTIQGNAITMRGTVTNLGNLSTGVGYSYKFQYRWSSTDPWSDMGAATLVAPLAAGAALNVVSNSFSPTRSGNLEVQLVVDPTGAVIESNEADNVIVGTPILISPPLTPNLVPQSAGLVSGTLVAGTLQTFTGTIKNTGTGPSSGSSARYCFNNSSCAINTTNAFATPFVSGLSAGGIANSVGGSWTPATAGSYTIFFCAVGGTCISTGPFTVTNPPPTSCNANGIPVANNETKTFYNNACAFITSTCQSNSMVPPVPPEYNQVVPCVPPPPVAQDEVMFSVSTLFVRAGSQVELTWNGGNADSCTVSGTNGFLSTGPKVGSAILSGPITQKTIFTASCQKGSGATQTTKTAPPLTINLIPNQIEI